MSSDDNCVMKLLDSVMEMDKGNSYEAMDILEMIDEEKLETHSVQRLYKLTKGLIWNKYFKKQGDHVKVD